MTVQIKLEYEGYLYLSQEEEINEDALEKARNLLKDISEFKVESLIIKNGKQEYYFNKSILEKSIITLITK